MQKKFNKLKGGWIKDDEDKWKSLIKNRNEIQQELNNETDLNINELINKNNEFLKKNIDEQVAAQCSKHAIVNMVSHLFPKNHNLWKKIYESCDTNMRLIEDLDNDIFMVRNLTDKKIYHYVSVHLENTKSPNFKNILTNITLSETNIKRIQETNFNDVLDKFGVKDIHYTTYYDTDENLIVKAKDNDEELQEKLNIARTTEPKKMKLLGLILGDGGHYTAIKALHIGENTRYYHIDSKHYKNNIKPISIDKVIEKIKEHSNILVSVPESGSNYQFAVRAYMIEEDDLPKFSQIDQDSDESSGYDESGADESGADESKTGDTSDTTSSSIPGEIPATRKAAEREESQRVAEEAREKREAERAESQRVAEEARAKKEAERAKKIEKVKNILRDLKGKDTEFIRDNLYDIASFHVKKNFKDIELYKSIQAFKKEKNHIPNKYNDDDDDKFKRKKNKCNQKKIKNKLYKFENIIKKSYIKKESKIIVDKKNFNEFKNINNLGFLTELNKINTDSNKYEIEITS